MEKKAIYQAIVDHAILLDQHRKELVRSRGFSEEVIDTLKFKSCGRELVQSMNGTLPKDWISILESDRVLIPYLGPTGNVEFIRPHKLGLPEEGVQVYIPYPYLGENLDRIVLAESEFKAVASCLLGIPAIGIPGIGSFSKKNLPFLIEILKVLEVKNVVVCFDNEIKDDPAFENYKPDFTKRYDTMIYEYVMAVKLKRAGFETKIGRLLDEWRVNGKADIDGCLAQGISQKDYQEVIDRAIDYDEYRSKWKIPNAHKSFVERSIDRKFYNGPIEEIFKSYYLVSGEKKRKITNFKLKIAYTMHGGSGAERYCKLESHYGNSNSVVIKPEIMVSKGAFQKFCYELGDYEYTGSDKDLQTIWHYAFLHQTGISVKRLRSYGYDAETGIWFFAHGAYFKNKFHKVNDDGIVWVDDSGFMLPDRFGDQEKADVGIDPPLLSDADTGVNIKDIFFHLQNILDKGLSRLLIGWTLGNFFMPEILKAYEVYPFLFLYGKQQAGKSTITNWLSQFFGFTQKGFPFAPSSTVGISRAVSKLSMVPVWLEEYRASDPNLASKNNLLRSIYDKSIILKGTKNPDEIKTYRPRSTIILSGEEGPKDSALISRCLMVPAFRGNYDPDLTSYKWMMANAHRFNSVGHEILIKKDEYWLKVKERIEDYLKAFDSDLKEADRRNRIHLSTLAGVCDVFLGETDEFTNFVGTHAIERSRSVNLNQALNVFFDDAESLFGMGKLPFKFIKEIAEPKKSESEVAFWFQGVYAAWESHYKGLRNDIPASKTAILEHLKTEPYFIASSEEHRIEAKKYRCVILDAAHKEFPSALKNILINSKDDRMFQTNLGESHERTEPVEAKPIFGNKSKR